MECIKSKSNKKILELKKQINNDLLFLDSPKLIQEAINSGNKLETILVEEGKSFDFLKNETFIYVSKEIIESFSSVKTSQGIIATIKTNEKILKPPSGNFLVLDNVQDAGNVGTLIRSALGANFLNIYLINCASLNNIKVVRSSMGAIFYTNCYKTKFEEISNLILTNNLKLYSADMNGANIFKSKTDYKGVGIVVGNEGNGVSKDIEKLCCGSLKLPMNNNLESLNAGVSGSIMMYQIAYGGK